MTHPNSRHTRQVFEQTWQGTYVLGLHLHASAPQKTDKSQDGARAGKALFGLTIEDNQSRTCISASPELLAGSRNRIVKTTVDRLGVDSDEPLGWSRSPLD